MYMSHRYKSVTERHVPYVAGLCPEGHAGRMIDDGDNTYGGRYVVNPSGGLISKGHPLGATGLAQCAELCWQVRCVDLPAAVNHQPPPPVFSHALPCYFCISAPMSLVPLSLSPPPPYPLLVPFRR